MKAHRIIDHIVKVEERGTPVLRETAEGRLSQGNSLCSLKESLNITDSAPEVF